MIPVVEKFLSIQGEGRRVGHPSVFLRLGGCNLRCQGFGVGYDVNGEAKKGCDSWFGVDPGFRKNWSIYTQFNELVHDLDTIGLNIDKSEKPDLVITGGEPTIHWNNPEFQKLLVYYISRQVNITIESNASLNLNFTKPYQKNIAFSMSVKLSNSGEPEHKRINIDAITNILENAPSSYFKFVVDKANGSQIMDEINSILDQVPYYADVFLMPLGDTKEKVQENAEYVANECVKYNFIYSPREHINIWDNKQGV